MSLSASALKADSLEGLRRLVLEFGELGGRRKFKIKAEETKM